MNTNNAIINRKRSFWALIQRGIQVPTLQRDYIYGACTPKTDEVLDHLLETFADALDTGEEETLDFIYGSDSRDGKFMPLDGQQRLTTLFLLHYYAALTGGADDAAFRILNGFRYATRNCTLSFCDNLLHNRREDIRNLIDGLSQDDKHAVSEWLKDQDEFRGAYWTDPSIRSMLEVLDRIHIRFFKRDDLWGKLTAEDCPINFYLLDFGVFNLSDDLYNKMNSRGKPLTEFEIFKSKFHQNILHRDPGEAEKTVIKMDTDWMDFIWQLCGLDMQKVDTAYLQTLRQLWRIFDYEDGVYDKTSTKPRFTELDDNCIVYNSSAPRAEKLTDWMDTLSKGWAALTQVPLWPAKDITDSLVNGQMSLNTILYLYAGYLGLKLQLSDTDFALRMRHIRNLQVNSMYEIREARMSRLLEHVALVMNGQIGTISGKDSAFNEHSWEEERHKDLYPQVWAALFGYEEITEINGTIQAFANGLTPDNRLHLEDAGFVVALIQRLRKCEYFFKSVTTEPERRAALLTLGDYSIIRDTRHPFFGVMPNSWRYFTNGTPYEDKEHFMQLIDLININSPIKADWTGIPAENWRYYAVKYAREITVAYGDFRYGYIAFPSSAHEKSSGRTCNNLDAVVLQSSQFGPSNVCWSMLHRIADQLYNEELGSHYFLSNKGGAAFNLYAPYDGAEIRMTNDGWAISGIESRELSRLGIAHTVDPTDKGLILLSHSAGADYVKEWGMAMRCLFVGTGVGAFDDFFVTLHHECE